MLSSLSRGTQVIVALAAVSAIAVFWPHSKGDEPDFRIWLFARPHQAMYEPIVERWNATDEEPVGLDLLSLAALEHRMLAAFFAGIHTADLIEVERSVAGRAFTGPVESIGFLDLTDRMEAEGLFERINPPSLAPWTSRGRVFGLPHDVHPVMLGYRSDLVEGAGIDVSTIETWDDFERITRAMVVDTDGDGSPDRYPLAFWPSDLDKLELLMLQGDATFFKPDGSPDLHTRINAQLLARLVSWCVGPDRIAAEVPDFSASGNAMKVSGRASFYFMPDWMGDVWGKELPGLSGSMRLMPLPAWSPGGRRTSVWGGTMLAIPKTAPDPDQSWKFAKHLYVSRELARELYTVGGIITPITSYWDDPIYDEPEPYFGGQRVGRMYIDLAPDVPVRDSSPYSRRALERLGDAGLMLLDYANRERLYEPAELEDRAYELLEEAQFALERQMERTAVFREQPGATQ